MEYFCVKKMGGRICRNDFFCVFYVFERDISRIAINSLWDFIHIFQSILRQHTISWRNCNIEQIDLIIQLTWQWDT